MVLGDSIAWGRCFFLIRHRDTELMSLYALLISGGAVDGVDKDADGSDR